jgi:hypothetical protein
MWFFIKFYVKVTVYSRDHVADNQGASVKITVKDYLIKPYYYPYVVNLKVTELRSPY